MYYTCDIAHRDKDGDYQIFGRADDAIRYRGELLNLPIIEGAAVSLADLKIFFDNVSINSRMLATKA